MSKRRKHHTKKHHTRRHTKRHSGLGAIDFTNILGVAAGAVAAGFLNKVIPATIDSKIVAGGKIALGVALPMFVKSGKLKGIMSGVGAGMIAVGAVDLLRGFGVLSGADDSMSISLNGDQDFLGDEILGADVLGDDIMNGIDDLSVVNADVLGDDELHGIDDISVVNGLDEGY